MTHCSRATARLRSPFKEEDSQRAKLAIRYILCNPAITAHRRVDQHGASNKACRLEKVSVGEPAAQLSLAKKLGSMSDGDDRRHRYGSGKLAVVFFAKAYLKHRSVSTTADAP